MTHDTPVGIPVILAYRHWVQVLEAIDSAREETVKAAAANKTGFAARKALQASADLYTLIGEDLSKQLEPESWSTAQDFGGLLPEDIPDPRDSDPTTTPPRRGKRKNGPLADL